MGTNEVQAEAEAEAYEGWDPTFLHVWRSDFGEVGSGRSLALGYIGGLAQAQQAAWEAAEEQIAEAIFHCRYRDPADLWGQVTERERAVSWEELAGSALMVSRETARKRFRDRVEAIRRSREEGRAEAQAAYEAEWDMADGKGGE